MASSVSVNELWYERLDYSFSQRKKHIASSNAPLKQLTLYVVDCGCCMAGDWILESKKFVVRQLLNSALNHRPNETCAVAAWTSTPYLVYKPGTPTEMSIRLACNRLRTRATDFSRSMLDTWLAQAAVFDDFNQATLVVITNTKSKLESPKELSEWRTQRPIQPAQCQCLYTTKLRLGSGTECIEANVKAYATTKYRPQLPVVYVATEKTNENSIKYTQVTEQPTEASTSSATAMSELPAYLYGKTCVYSVPELATKLSVQPPGPAGIDVLEIVDESEIMLMPPGIMLAGTDARSKAILGSFGHALLKRSQIAVVRTNYTSIPPRYEPTVNALAGIPGKSELYMARLPTLGEYNPAFDLRPLDQPSLVNTSIVMSEIAKLANTSSQINFGEPSTEAHLDVAVDYLVS